MPLLLSFACHLPTLPCHHGPPSLVLLAVLNSINVSVWVRRPCLCRILHLMLHHCHSECASHSICWTVTYDDCACPRQQHHVPIVLSMMSCCSELLLCKAVLDS